MSVLKLDAFLDPNALVIAKQFIAALRADYQLKDGQHIDTIFKHWTAGSYQTVDRQYNFCIREREDHTLFDVVITNDPRNNAVDDKDLVDGIYAAHTYRKNSHAVGIGVCSMGGDNIGSHWFGPFGPTLHQMEMSEAVAGAIGLVYDIDVSDPKGYRTHAEDALITPTENTVTGKKYPHYYCFKADGDPDCRWDFACEESQDKPPTEKQAIETGNIFRARAHQYKNEFILRKL